MTPKCFCKRNAPVRCEECQTPICMKHYYSGLCEACADAKIAREIKQHLDWLEDSEFDPYKDKSK